MSRLIDWPPYDWYGLYKSQAQDGAVTPGRRVERGARSDGWMSHNFDFDASWFKANGFEIPPLYHPDEVEERRVDHGRGLWRIDLVPKPNLRAELRDAWRYDTPLCLLTHKARYVIAASAIALVAGFVLMVAVLW